MGAFLDVSVHPMYGQHQAAIRWVLGQPHTGLGVRVFRSLTGTAPWTLLNPSAPITTGEYVDETLKDLSRHDKPFYRLLAGDSPEQYSSPIFGPYETLNRLEYGACRRMMQVVYTQLSRGDGIPILHFQPRVDLQLPNLDEDTKQDFGPSCAETTDYSQLFYPPIQSWLHLKPPNIITREASDGMGLDDADMNEGMLLGFPYARFGDMIVNRAMDDRYVVIGSRPKKFRGIVPILFEVSLALLHKSDNRYKVDLPELVTELPYIP